MLKETDFYNNLFSSTIPVLEQAYLSLPYETDNRSGRSRQPQGRRPVVLVGQNLHLPSIVIFQSGDRTYTAEPRKSFFDTLTVDVGDDWSYGRYAVSVGTSRKLKMYDSAVTSLLLPIYPEVTGGIVPGRPDAVAGGPPMIDIDQKQKLPFLSKKGGIDLRFSVTVGDEIFPVLSFFIHIILPFLVPTGTHWSEMWKTGAEVLRSLSSVSRAFFRYFLRVRAYQSHYKEIQKEERRPWRCLHYACSFGDSKMVNEIYKHKSDTFQSESTKQLEDGTTIGFFNAVIQGHKDIALILLKIIPKCLTYHTPDRVSALHVAALYARTSIMQLILTLPHGQDLLLMETRTTRETPLFHAIMSNSQVAVNLLLKHGADKKKENFNSQTPKAFMRSLDLNLKLTASPYTQEELQNIVQKKNVKGSSKSPKVEARKGYSLSDFEIKERLGKGAFGEVVLAMDKSTGKHVAIKQMVKSYIKQKGKKEHVDNEKKILQLAQEKKKKFLVQMYRAFHDAECLYIAMEFCPGGDLREFLDVVDTLDEEEAKLWFAEMIVGVHSLHELGYIHRDLKPENFFIDCAGHMKLGDFGLSKESGLLKMEETAADRTRKQHFSLVGHDNAREKLTIDNFSKRFQSIRINKPVKPVNKNNRIGLLGAAQTSTTMNPTTSETVSSPRKPNNFVQLGKVASLAYSIVGSPPYMSPEVLKAKGEDGTQGQGYGHEVDWWSLGCVFFECIVGEPPFSGNTVEEVFSMIENWEKQLPEILDNSRDKMSVACYSLLCGFLTTPIHRLGRNILNLQRHEFFLGLDWDHLEQIKSPNIPLTDRSSNV